MAAFDLTLLVHFHHFLKIDDFKVLNRTPKSVKRKDLKLWHAHTSHLRSEKSKTKNGVRCCFMSKKAILDKLSRSEVIAIATKTHSVTRALQVLEEVREALPNYEQALDIKF